jgi:hypothetical protein
LRKALVLVLVYLIVSAAVAVSQTRRRSTPRRSPRTSTTQAEKVSAEVQAGRQRLASQIKTLTQFLYLFGGIAKGIESADEEARRGEASPPAIKLNERNKTTLRENIRRVREGLDKLEYDFRFTPALTRYYTHLAGVARTGETAENQAAANRFDEAGRSLLKSVERLTDTLVAMR